MKTVIKITISIILSGLFLSGIYSLCNTNFGPALANKAEQNLDISVIDGKDKYYSLPIDETFNIYTTASDSLSAVSIASVYKTMSFKTRLSLPERIYRINEGQEINLIPGVDYLYISDELGGGMGTLYIFNVNSAYYIVY